MSLQSFDDEPMMFDEATEEQPMQEEYQPEPQYRKQGFTIYTLMLLLSFIFLTTASIIFFNFAE